MSTRDDPRGHFITREEASNIALAAAKEAARQTLNETFALFGVNLANFDAVQQFRDDVEFARRARKLSELTGKRVWTTFIGLGAGGLAIALFEWAKSLFPHNP